MSGHGPITDKEKQFFNAFKLAIESERGAQDDYGKMAAMAEDPETRELFEGLQREEAGHEEKLLQLYGEYKARFMRE